MPQYHVEELLSAYLDGELTPLEKVDVERQLEHSLELREQLAALTEISLQLRMLPRPYAPAALRAGVMEALDRGQSAGIVPAARRRPAPRLRRAAGWSAVSAAAGLLLVIGWSLHQLPKQAALPQHNSFAFAPPESPARESTIAPSMQAGLRTADAESPQPVQVISVSKEEIGRRIHELNHLPMQGNSIHVPGHLKSENEETPIVVVFTVVDVMEAMNRMQVLVQQQQVRSRDNQLIAVNREPAENSQLTAVTLELEMDGPEMAAVLNSVAAFDAVMYVEQDVRHTVPGEGANLQAIPTTMSEGAAKEATSLAKQNEQSNAAAKPTLEHQRQFIFQKLAEPAGMNTANPSTASTDTEADHDRQTRSTGTASSTRTKPETGHLLTGSANADRPSPAGAVPPSALTTPMAAEKSGTAFPQVARSQPTDSVNGSQNQPVREHAPSWDEARRFRAFILLKQQTPATPSPPPAR